uniref:Uncharacterized protein n=1 Tax=Corethron hystrix TaxID=216773 RepID=A0A7S1C2Q6_9STRA|mmetsp:Transcript_9899/g.22092  ORF Transcript_9899/g.22092 Transcript_9899/m.22092 type:complete len:143 (+) Transcript_9899:248-676(+)
MIARQLAARVKSCIQICVDSNSMVLQQMFGRHQPWLAPVCDISHGDFQDSICSGSNEKRCHTSVMDVLGGVLINDQTIADSDAVWFAVPKRKHTRSRKRKKTTSQKRIPLKTNIVRDKTTGEFTLMHHLPFGWKNYIHNEGK